MKVGRDKKFEFNICTIPCEDCDDGSLEPSMTYNYLQEHSNGSADTKATWVDDAASGNIAEEVSSSGGTISTPDNCNGIWVKNLGTTPIIHPDGENGLEKAIGGEDLSEDNKLTITIGSVVVAELSPDNGIFFSSPQNNVSDFITFGIIGDKEIAVEYAIYAGGIED